MKHTLAWLLCLVMVLSPLSSLADKARGIVSEADSLYHENHLKNHLDTKDCYATGNYIKTRVRPGSSRLAGHLEQADTFILSEVYDGYAKIEVVFSASSSPDSYQGMTGWVDLDYIDCPCTTYQYSDSAPVPTSLESLIGTTRAVCVGDNVRVRSAPVNGEVRGHLERADEFMLLALQNGWAQIRVTRSSSLSADSWNGLTGWVSADYIAAAASSPARPAAAPTPAPSSNWFGYGSVLETFYTSVFRGWDREQLYTFGFEADDYPNRLEDAGFIFCDPDQNGVSELLLLRRTDSSMGPVIAMYTLKNGNPVQVFSAHARNRFYLLNNGLIYNEGSSGAAYTVCSLYALRGDQLVLQEEVYSSDYQQNGKNMYAWFRTNQAGHTHEVRFDWMISDSEAYAWQNTYQSQILYSFPQAYSLLTYK